MLECRSFPPICVPEKFQIPILHKMLFLKTFQKPGKNCLLFPQQQFLESQKKGTVPLQREYSSLCCIGNGFWVAGSDSRDMEREGTGTPNGNGKNNNNNINICNTHK